MAKYVKIILTLAFFAAGCIVFPLCSSALDGRGLAQKVYDRDDGKDSYAKVRMLLVDKRGKKRFRTLITAVKEYGSTIKSYTRFTSPADIDGTSFLTWENEEREDDQFLYLPALKRVRRIVSTQKKNRFVNTDYTYEDLERRKVGLDCHKILREEKVGTYDCWVLERTPKELKKTQYSKRISWIAMDIYVPVKTVYYDKKGRLLKEFFSRRIRRVDGIWSITESEMHDHKRKHRTLMKTTELRYNRGVSDRVFTKAYMMHAE